MASLQYFSLGSPKMSYFQTGSHVSLYHSENVEWKRLGITNKVFGNGCIKSITASKSAFVRSMWVLSTSSVSREAVMIPGSRRMLDIDLYRGYSQSDILAESGCEVTGAANLKIWGWEKNEESTIPAHTAELMQHMLLTICALSTVAKPFYRAKYPCTPPYTSHMHHPVCIAVRHSAASKACIVHAIHCNLKPTNRFHTSPAPCRTYHVLDSSCRCM